MLSCYRLAAICLLLVSDVDQAFAEPTRFPLGYVWYVSCSTVAPLGAREDALPGADPLYFGFSDDRGYNYDLIVGPVISDTETVQFSYFTHITPIVLDAFSRDRHVGSHK